MTIEINWMGEKVRHDGLPPFRARSVPGLALSFEVVDRDGNGSLRFEFTPEAVYLDEHVAMKMAEALTQNA